MWSFLRQPSLIWVFLLLYCLKKIYIFYFLIFLTSSIWKKSETGLSINSPRDFSPFSWVEMYKPHCFQMLFFLDLFKTSLIFYKQLFHDVSFYKFQCWDLIWIDCRRHLILSLLNYWHLFPQFFFNHGNQFLCFQKSDQFYLIFNQDDLIRVYFEFR